MLTFIYILSIISAAAIFVADARFRLIPDVWLWPLLLAGLWLYGGFADNIVAAVIGYCVGFVLMIATAKKEAVGFGDVKLLAVAGLWLGVDRFSVAVVAACVLGIAWGLWKKERFVPFAPFLFAGAAIAGLVI
ncbi:MAG: A24 family peptidase [Rickettsiales bacterium]|jgi:prepilin signal peptidase PulO-like enzyme (type II secretory pathway)|nr:A24 family peptidase [Rickettsiales bacterium]